MIKISDSDFDLIETRESLFEIFRFIYEEYGKNIALSIVEDMEIFVNEDCEE